MTESLYPRHATQGGESLVSCWRERAENAEALLARMEMKRGPQVPIVVDIDANAWRERAEKAEAQVKELEEISEMDKETLDQIWKLVGEPDLVEGVRELQARVKELEAERAQGPMYKARALAAEARLVQCLDLCEEARGVIANASRGDWEQEATDWRKAAAVWRDKYHQALADTPAPVEPPTFEPKHDPAYLALSVGGKIEHLASGKKTTEPPKGPWREVPPTPPGSVPPDPDHFAEPVDPPKAKEPSIDRDGFCPRCGTLRVPTVDNPEGVWISPAEVAARIQKARDEALSEALKLVCASDGVDCRDDLYNTGSMELFDAIRKLKSGGA